MLTCTYTATAVDPATVRPATTAGDVDPWALGLRDAAQAGYEGYATLDVEQAQGEGRRVLASMTSLSRRHYYNVATYFDALAEQDGVRLVLATVVSREGVWTSRHSELCLLLAVKDDGALVVGRRAYVHTTGSDGLVHSYDVEPQWAAHVLVAATKKEVECKAARAGMVPAFEVGGYLDAIGLTGAEHAALRAIAYAMVERRAREAQPRDGVTAENWATTTLKARPAPAPEPAPANPDAEALPEWEKELLAD